MLRVTMAAAAMHWALFATVGATTAWDPLEYDLPSARDRMAGAHLPNWGGYRNHSKAQSLEPANSTSHLHLSTLMTTASLPCANMLSSSCANSGIAQLETHAMDNARPSMSVWFVFTSTNTDISMDHDAAMIRLRASAASQGQGLMTGNRVLQMPSIVDNVVTDTKDIMSELKDLELSQFSPFTGSRSGSTWLPRADGHCVEAASESGPDVRTAAGAFGMGFTGAGTARVGAECPLDLRNGAGTSHDIESMLNGPSERAIAAVLVILPARARYDNMTKAESFTSQLTRPRVAGTWAWSDVYPSGWEPWLRADARVIQSVNPWSGSTPQLAMSVDLASFRLWNAALQRILFPKPGCQNPRPSVRVRTFVESTTSHALRQQQQQQQQQVSNEIEIPSALVPGREKHTLAIAASSPTYHTLFLMEDGCVLVAGLNGFGKLGLGSDDSRGRGNTPETVPWRLGCVPLNGMPSTGPDSSVSMGTRVVMVAVGSDASAAVTSDGDLFTWGKGSSLGMGSTNSIGDSPSSLPGSRGPVSLGGNAVSVTAGLAHMLVVLDTQELQAFGAGNSGQLGRGSPASVGDTFTTYPALVGKVDLGGAKLIGAAAGMLHSAIMVEGHGIKVFGSGCARFYPSPSTSNVGHTPSTSAALLPLVSVLDRSPAKPISITASSSGSGVRACVGVVYSDGTVLMAGACFSSTYPTTTTLLSSESEIVRFQDRGLRFGAGFEATVVMDDGTVRGQASLGSLEELELGLRGSEQAIGGGDRFREGAIPLSNDVATLVSHGTFRLFVLVDGSVQVSGTSDSGHCGTGNSQGGKMADWPCSPFPAPELQSSNIASCVLGEAPRTIRSPAHVQSKLPLARGPRAVSISGGAESVFSVLLEDGTFRVTGISGTAVGMGWSDLIGTPSMPEYMPIAFSNITVGTGENRVAQVLSINSGTSCSGVAVRTHSGEIYMIPDCQTPAWPVYAGASRTSAVSVGAVVTNIYAGFLRLFAITANGTVRAWGDGFWGEFGDGIGSNLGDQPSTLPSTVGDLPWGPPDSVSYIASSESHTVIVKTNGQVIAVGSNFNGELCISSNTAYRGDTPATTVDKLSSLPNVSAIHAAAGNTWTAIVQSDGTLRMCGSNGDGELGLGHRLPVPTGFDAGPAGGSILDLGTPAVAASAGYGATLVLMLDGSVQSFGSNEFGDAGRGSRTSIGSAEANSPAVLGPIEIGGRAVAVTTTQNGAGVLLENGDVLTFGIEPGLVSGAIDGMYNGGTPDWWMPPFCMASTVFVSPGRFRPGLSVSPIVQADALTMGSQATPMTTKVMYAAQICTATVMPLVSQGGTFDQGYGIAKSTTLSVPLGSAVPGRCATGTANSGQQVEFAACTAPASVTRSAALGTGVEIAGSLHAAIVDSQSQEPRQLLADGSIAGINLAISGLAEAWSSMHFVRDDSAELLREACADNEQVMQALDQAAAEDITTASVWLIGESSSGVRWERRARGCSFSSLTTLECTILPPGSGLVQAELRVLNLYAESLMDVSIYTAQSVGNLSYQLPIIEALAPQSNLPVIGEGILTLLGSGFGIDPADIPRVDIVGVGPCLNVTRESDSVVRCIAPRGTGTRLRAKVSVGIQSIETSGTITTGYEAPVLDTMTPEYLLAGEVGDVTLNGTGLALGAADATHATVGGIGCDTVVVAVPGRSIVCRGFTAPMDGVWPEATVVNVSVSGQSSGPVRTLFQGLGAPVIQAAVSLNGRDPTAGDAVRIVGTGFGREDRDIKQVHFGTALGACNLENAVAGYLRCIAPAAVGTVAVTVESRTGVVSDPVSLRFAAPEVLSVEPAYLLAGDVTANLTVSGRNLAIMLADVTNETIAGAKCLQWHIVSPGSVMMCERVLLSSTHNGEVWSSPDEGLRVRIGDQWSQATPRSVFRVFDAPAATVVAPNVLGPGDVVTVAGSGFGMFAADIHDVVMSTTTAVEIAGTGDVSSSASCQLTAWAETILTCTLPSASHPVWQIVAEEGAITSLRVVNAAGVAGPALNVATQGDVTQLLPVPRAPWQVRARRPIGRFSDVEVQWLFLGEEAETALRANTQRVAVSDYLVEAWPILLDHEEQQHGDIVTNFTQPSTTAPSWTAMTGAAVAVHATSAELLGHPEAAVFRATLTVSVETPLALRVTPTNTHGRGVSSHWVLPVTANCETQSFLDQRGPMSSWACAPCPDGAACGGLQHTNVSAMEGFWRLPWSTLAFAPCKTPTACLGTPASWSTTSAGVIAANATLLFHPELTGPAASGVLSQTVQGCAEGRTGVLCEACIPGWAPSMGECAPCGDPAASWSLAIFICLVVLTGLSTVLYRAEKSASKPKPPRQMLVAKVLLSHLQTLSIISGVRLEWPPAVRAMFAASDTTTSFTASSLGLLCPAGDISGVGVTALSMGVAAALVAYVPVMWLCIWHCKDCLSKRTASAVTSARIAGRRASAMARGSFRAASTSAGALIRMASGKKGDRGHEEHDDDLVGRETRDDDKHSRGDGGWACCCCTSHGTVLNDSQSLNKSSSHHSTGGPHAGSAGTALCIRNPLNATFQSSGDSAGRSPQSGSPTRPSSPIGGGIIDRRASGLQGHHSLLTADKPAITIISPLNRVRMTSAPAAATAATSDKEALPDILRDDKAGTAEALPDILRDDKAGTAANAGFKPVMLGRASSTDSKSGKIKLRAIVKLHMSGVGSWSTWRRQVFGSLVAVALLLHSPIAKMALSLLACEQVGDSVSASRRLSLDLDVDCNDSEWTAARLGIALPTIVLYSVPFPIIIALALWLRRKSLDRTTTRQIYGVLYRGFRLENAYAWEAVVSLRKLLLGMVTVLLETQGPLAQAVGGLLVLVVALAMHAWVKPYVYASVNRLELFAMLATCATLALAIAIQATELGLVQDAGNASARVAFSVMIALLNAMVVIEAVRTSIFRHVRFKAPQCNFLTTRRTIKDSKA